MVARHFWQHACLPELQTKRPAFGGSSAWSISPLPAASRAATKTLRTLRDNGQSGALPAAGAESAIGTSN